MTAGPATPRDWTSRLPALAELDPPVRVELARRARVVSAPAGATIFAPGQTADHLLFLLSGTVRVSQTSDSGREIVLYRVEPGQSCVMTTACLLADEAYQAEGVAETPVEAVAIPHAVFDDLASRSTAFRDLIFHAYAQRIHDLFRVINDVAFGRIDIRLAQRLLALSRGGDTIETTHQQLAVELGTAREVVSRQLQEFQRQGWITLSRGAIRIDMRNALETLGAG